VLLTFSPASVELPPKRLKSQGFGFIIPETLRVMRSYHAIPNTKLYKN